MDIRLVSKISKPVLKEIFARLQRLHEPLKPIKFNICLCTKIYNELHSEEQSLPNDDSVTCYLLTLHWNDESPCLPYQLLVSIYNYYQSFLHALVHAISLSERH